MILWRFAACYGWVTRRPPQRTPRLSLVAAGCCHRRCLSVTAGRLAAGPSAETSDSVKQPYTAQDYSKFDSYLCFSVMSDHDRPLVRSLAIEWYPPVSKNTLTEDPRSQANGTSFCLTFQSRTIRRLFSCYS